MLARRWNCSNKVLGTKETTEYLEVITVLEE